MDGIRTEIESKCLSEESPFGVDYVLGLVQNVANSEDDLIKTLLAELQKKSSKHKFLINTSRVASPERIEANLHISTNFGAVWDGKRDGFITLKVTCNKEDSEDSKKTSNDNVNDSNDNDICDDLDTQTGSIGAVNANLITIYWIYSG